MLLKAPPRFNKQCSKNHTANKIVNLQHFFGLTIDKEKAISIFHILETDRSM